MSTGPPPPRDALRALMLAPSSGASLSVSLLGWPRGWPYKSFTSALSVVWVVKRDVPSDYGPSRLAINSLSESLSATLPACNRAKNAAPSSLCDVLGGGELAGEVRERILARPLYRATRSALTAAAVGGGVALGRPPVL